MRKSLLSCLFLTCLHQPLFASNTFFIPVNPHGWFVGANAGATLPQVSTNTYVATIPGWPNDQYHYSHTNAATLLSLLGGYTWSTSHRFLPSYSLGVSYSYVYPSTIGGRIRQFSLPTFENYNFQYQVQRQTILAIFKADIQRWSDTMPFITAGAGLSINKASNYQEQALTGVTPRVSPGFGSQTNTQFSYTVGAGLDYIVKKNVTVSLEYNYGYFGHVQTGYGNGQRLSTALSANTIMVSANYFLASA